MTPEQKRFFCFFIHGYHISYPKSLWPQITFLWDDYMPIKTEDQLFQVFIQGKLSLAVLPADDQSFWTKEQLTQHLHYLCEPMFTLKEVTLFDYGSATAEILFRKQVSFIIHFLRITERSVGAVRVCDELNREKNIGRDFWLLQRVFNYRFLKPRIPSRERKNLKSDEEIH